MKKHLLLITLLGCLMTQAQGQVSYGACIGISPAVSPGTNHLIVNRGQVNESIFNIQNVRYSPQAGLMVRMDINRFWFMGEVMYGQYKTQYTIQAISEISTESGMATYCEKRGFLEIPLSAGVMLGKVELFSGFHVSREFVMDCELTQMEGFNQSKSETHLGWHSGIGYNLGPVLIDLRYQQQFCNYGKGRFISGQELLLKNAPGRLLASVAFRI